MQLANATVQRTGWPSVIGNFINHLFTVRWTIGLTAAMLLANWGVLANSPSCTTLLHWLEYDRDGISHGQLWRLITGNLVHWSPEHFWLDVGAFFLLGIMYEPSFKRPVGSYCTFLLAVSLTIGGALLVFLPGMSIYRGLSGVDSGIFAAALVIEAAQAQKDHRRWLFLAPAAVLFITKIIFECCTGELFFGTSSLGNLGRPVPLAHAAGALAVLPLLLTTSRSLTGRRKRCTPGR